MEIDLRKPEKFVKEYKLIILKKIILKVKKNFNRKIK